MNTTGCQAIEVLTQFGDQHGGIAASTSNVFASGDNGTWRWDALSLTAPFLASPMTVPHHGLIGTLRSGDVYLLTTDGTPIRSVGSADIRVNGMVLMTTTGGLGTTRITFSQPVVLPGAASGRFGFFAGYDRMVLYDGARAWNVNTVTGAVSDLGAVTLTSPNFCETLAIWGIAEFFSGSVHLVYAQRSPTGVVSIGRTRVSDGVNTTIVSLAMVPAPATDLCSIAAGVSRSRWYFAHEYGSQFLANAQEVVGYCSAGFTSTNP